MIDFKGLEDLSELERDGIIGATNTAAKPATESADIIASGFTCTMCKGRGHIDIYRRGGGWGQIPDRRDCWKCKGKGKTKTSPEQRRKAKEYRENKKAKLAQAVKDSAQAFLTENPTIAQWFSRNSSWEFCASLWEALHKYGRLSEKQLAAAQKCADKMLARDAEKAKERAAQQEENPLDLRGMVSGFYAVPGGDTRLKVRIDVPTKGQWKGWVFVSDGAAYGQRTRYGSQRPNEFYTGKIREQLAAIVASPLAASKAYGKLVGACGVCGRKLEDPESVAAGIGPVCAGKF